MKYGTTFEQGDVLLLAVPFSDLSGSKRRPVMVLSNSTYNRNGTDFLVCAMTAHLEHAAHSVLIDAADFAEGSVPRPSRIRADKLFAAHQKLVRSRLGRLKHSVVGQVKKELASIL